VLLLEDVVERKDDGKFLQCPSAATEGSGLQGTVADEEELPRPRATRERLPASRWPRNRDVRGVIGPRSVRFPAAGKTLRRKQKTNRMTIVKT
jgi:hypothetical protein